ncbi:hypothetical protein EMIT0111MI5_90203 [Burkholderia sp. IT-111MI5]
MPRAKRSVRKRSQRRLTTSLGLLKLKSNIVCIYPLLCQLAPKIIELTSPWLKRRNS